MVDENLSLRIHIDIVGEGLDPHGNETVEHRYVSFDPERRDKGF